MSLSLVSPGLSFWSDASDVGWDSHLAEEVASGLWSSHEEVKLYINTWELLAMERGLHFQPLLVGSTVSIFVDNSTAMTYLRNHRGTCSSTLGSIAQRILRWAEPVRIVLTPQFITGRHNVLVDSFLAQSYPGLQVDAEGGSVSGSTQEVAGDGGPVCHLIQSLLCTLFLSFPRSVPMGRTPFFRTGMVFRSMPSLLGP